MKGCPAPTKCVRVTKWAFVGMLLSLRTYVNFYFDNIVRSQYSTKGDVVKRFALLLASVFAFSAHADECIKTDYQELKEFSQKELVSKYCKDKSDFDMYTNLAEFNQSMAEASEAIKDTTGQSKYLDKWGAANQSAKTCKSELDRVLRLLEQKNVNEAAAKAQCQSAS